MASEPAQPREYSALVPHLIKPTSFTPIEHTPGGALHVLHGDEVGLGDVSLLVSYNPPSGGPVKHTHSYIEIFVVQEGRGVYLVGDESFEAEVGDVVVVPSDMPHTFHATADSILTHLAIHQASHSVTHRVE